MVSLHEEEGRETHTRKGPCDEEPQGSSAPQDPGEVRNRYSLSTSARNEPYNASNEDFQPPDW